MFLKRPLLIICLILFSASLYGQKYTISGNMRDGQTGEDLIGSTVIVKENPGIGAVANVYGFYSLTLDSGSYTLVYSFIGFDKMEVPVKLNKDIVLDVELSKGSSQLDEVVITAEREDENITSTEMSVSKIEIREIENIPVLFGERDVLKTIQLLPGVKSAGEGNSGFFVRGGTADQNLILLDEAPVYNASHLLGFFSVFNSDALKDVKLYKGAIPAEYGGRLSSVVDIKMKEGNSKELKINGGIGLISSKLTIEAPIVKDKGSFIISGRRTYADVFLAFSNDQQTKNSILYFYDFNAKANYRIGEKDRIFLSGYFGRDNFGFGEQFGFDWGNITTTLRWNHVFNQKLFSNTSFIYSNYNYRIAFGGDEGVQIGSDIQDFNFKQDFDYFVNDKNTLKFGANIIHHTFKPGEVEVRGEESFIDNDIENRFSLESSIYVSNLQKFNDRLSMTYGVRYSNFTQFGPGNILTYNKEGDVTDTTKYDQFESVSSYNGIAPRAAATFVLNEKSSIKASYAKTFQYLHLISNATTTTPTDIWLPSSNNIKPEIADQIAFGYFRNFKNNTYEFSGEVYYKDVQRSIDYRTGAETTLNATVEGELLYGKARAYGIELLLRKNKGRFNGWLSYTLAKAEKQVEGINSGAWYSAKQDRTHDISIVGMYKFNERIEFSATWVYYTGNAVTFPSGKYEIDGDVVSLYTERNGYRMPAYHRMDLGMTLLGKNFKLVRDPSTGELKKVKRKIESSWNFSIYNAYMRKNAYSISFRESENDPSRTEAVRLTLFTIVPSISYNFKF
ncbi:MAG: TonB-dependent receptor [Bacteroidia bacterium]|nr:TonB-dependent receptor [Bacteroidia bacterium]